MADASNTNGNHDARGRFTAGNKAGQGNPHHRRVAELRAEVNLREDQVLIVDLGSNEDAARESSTFLGVNTPTQDTGTVVI